MMVPEAQPFAMAVASPGRRVKALQQRIAELTVTIAERDAFLAAAGGELCNSMKPILGQVDFLLTAIRAGIYSPEQVEQRLERIQRTIHYYVKLTVILLDAPQFTSGKLHPHRQPFDIAVLLRTVAEKYAEQARHAGVSITVNVPDNLPGIWDHPAVEQILDSLVSGALRYGARSPVELSAEMDGKQVRIQVRDHGTGISANDREQAAGRFEPVVGRSASRSGFGVGLWVISQLAEAMGGVVATEDAPGGGALITVTLPQHKEGECS